MDTSSPPPCRVALLPHRAVLALTGPDAKSFLDGLVTNDVNRLSPQRALYAGLLTPQGKLLVDFLLAERDGVVLVDVATAQAGALAQRLGLYKLRAKVAVETRPDWAVAVAFGPGTGARFGLAGGGAKPLGGGVVFADPRLDSLGVRVLGPAAEVPRALALPAAPQAVYDALRLGLGVGEGPEIGDERCYPLEANFESLHGVDFKKGCYVGQELTARMKHRAGLRKRVLPLHGDGAPAAEARIVAGTTEIGIVLTAAETRGLALVRLDRLAEAGAAPLSADGRPIHLARPEWLALDKPS